MQNRYNVPDYKNRQMTGDHASAAQFCVCIWVLACLCYTATLMLCLGYQNMHR